MLSGTGDGGEESDERRVVVGGRGSPESLVGLRILIQHPRRSSNIVTKSALMLCESNAGSRRPRGGSPDLGFLKACFLCRRKLSLEKDVYMYRGDQGFCSVECRAQQILMDERIEFEASKRDRWQRMKQQQQQQHHHHSAMPKIQPSYRRGRIASRA